MPDLRCPVCEAELYAPSSFIGESLRCNSCQSLIRVDQDPEGEVRGEVLVRQEPGAADPASEDGGEEKAAEPASAASAVSADEPRPATQPTHREPAPQGSGGGRVLLLTVAVVMAGVLGIGGYIFIPRWQHASNIRTQVSELRAAAEDDAVAEIETELTQLQPLLAGEQFDALSASTRWSLYRQAQQARFEALGAIVRRHTEAGRMLAAEEALAQRWDHFQTESARLSQMEIAPSDSEFHTTFSNKVHTSQTKLRLGLALARARAQLDAGEPQDALNAAQRVAADAARDGQREVGDDARLLAAKALLALAEKSLEDGDFETGRQHLREGDRYLTGLPGEKAEALRTELTDRQTNLIQRWVESSVSRATEAVAADNPERAFELVGGMQKRLEESTIADELRDDLMERMAAVRAKLDEHASRTIAALLDSAREGLRQGDAQTGSADTARRELEGLEYVSAERREELKERIDAYHEARSTLATTLMQEQIGEAMAKAEEGELQAALDTVKLVRNSMEAFEFLSEEDRQTLSASLEDVAPIVDQFEKMIEIANNAATDYEAAKKDLRNLLQDVPADSNAQKMLRRAAAAKLAEVERQEQEEMKAWIAGEGQNRPGIMLSFGHYLERQLQDAGYEAAFNPEDMDPKTKEIAITFNGRRYVLQARDRNDGRRALLVNVGGYDLWIPAMYLGYYWPASWLLRVGNVADQLKELQINPRPVRGQLSLWGVLPDYPFAGGNNPTIPGVELLVGRGQAFDVNHAPRNVNELRRHIGELQATVMRLHDAVAASEKVPERARGALTYLVQAAWNKPRQQDFLEQDYVRDLLAEGYIERLFPEVGKELAEPLEAYRKAYGEFSRLRTMITAKSPDEELVQYESIPHMIGGGRSGRAMWRIRNRENPEWTTFAMALPMEHSMTSMQLYNDFRGSVDEWEGGQMPDRVRVVHPALGELASYDVESDAFTVDRDLWEKAVRLDEYTVMEDHFAGSWRLAPHVVLLDHDGQTQAVVLETGRLDMPTFPEAQEERRAAQDAFMQDVARVLSTPGALRLFFEYFVQYTLDSPAPSQPDLLGSAQHNGDIHQDSHQFLDRFVGGRFACDCDDLAEFYSRIMRLNGKISYVCGVPGHATCGWVEVENEDNPEERRYEMYFLDTGPPRRFLSDSLHDVIEQGYRSYDDRGMLEFNPDSVQFMFRFAGEPTRTPYVLGARMFVDDEYGQALRNVQGMWHFHTYLQGINVMKEMVKEDPIPPNCFELAGLYRATRQFKKAIEWRRKGMRNSVERDADRISVLESKADIAALYMGDEDKESARKMLDAVADELKALEETEESRRFEAMRFSVAVRFSYVDRPVRGWRVIEEDAQRLIRDDELGDMHSFVTIEIYRKLSELVREKEKQEDEAPTEEQRQVLTQIEGLLERHLANQYFRKDDDLGDILRRYGGLARYYRGKYGDDYVQEKVLTDGPFPAPNSRNHVRRGGADVEDEDWKWIRLSFAVYSELLGEALPGTGDDGPGHADVDKDEKKADPELALKIIAAAERALNESKKHGSTTRQEWALLNMHLIRSMINRDLEEYEQILQKVRKEDWSPLYRTVAGTVGGGARLVDLDFFRKELELFKQYVPTKPQYFQLAYAAYRADAFEHAKVAGDMAADEYPDDPHMQNERVFLKSLCDQKAKEKAEKEAAEKEKQDAPADADEQAPDAETQPKAEEEAGREATLAPAA